MLALPPEKMSNTRATRACTYNPSRFTPDDNEARLVAGRNGAQERFNRRQRKRVRSFTLRTLSYILSRDLGKIASRKLPCCLNGRTVR
jgi:hypothetical protein